MSTTAIIILIALFVGAIVLASGQPAPFKPREGVWGQMDRLERIEALKEQRRAADSQIAALWAEYERERR